MNIFGHRKIQRVGIVGGLGPETTTEFYLDLIRKSRQNFDSYPSIIIDNVPFPFYLERDIIEKSVNEIKLLPFLKESIERLNKLDVDFIVIPCNTVHIFIEELRKFSKVPIISILEETLNFIQSNSIKKIGLLGTQKTIESKLYQIPLEKNGIHVILPAENNQKLLSAIIVKILENTFTENDKTVLQKIMYDLKSNGSEHILLVCTDLQLVLKNEDLVDTMQILASATFDRLTDISKNTNFKGR
ncbi:MAG: aspartate/glutamate racemase family protein [Candidatus Aenigmarchaeota archaeon]|nr:aspartate/glutamate racemase family protein [Candidatus Aenigmarchaeota archaeon]